MKRRFNKLPLIILLIAGIVLSGTAVLALNEDIAELIGISENKTADGLTEPSTPAMLYKAERGDNIIMPDIENDEDDVNKADPSITQDGELPANSSDMSEAGNIIQKGEDNDSDNSIKDDKKLIDGDANSNLESQETDVLNDSDDAHKPHSNELNNTEADDSSIDLSQVIEDDSKQAQSGLSATDSSAIKKAHSNARIVSGDNEVQALSNEDASQVNAQSLNGTVNVLVVNPAYGPVPGAVVSISNSSAVTNSGGWGTINAPAGNYVYVVQASGYRSSAGSLTVNAGSVNSINIVLIPSAQAGSNPQLYSAAFIIRDQTGEDARAAGVTVEIDNQVSVTNIQGIAVIYNLAPGVYQAKIGGAGYYESLVPVTITNGDVTQEIVITKTAEAIAAANNASASAAQPRPTPVSRPGATTSYKGSSGSGNSSGSSSSSNSSSHKSANSSDQSNTTTVLDEIKDGESSGKKNEESLEIIQSGELKPQSSPTPSPQPTKTPAPTPTPTPDAATYTVSFNLSNLNGTSIVGTSVELHSEVMTAKTDSQGFVTFENVPEGEHNLYLINNSGDITATKAFSINSGVQTELDIANVGGDKVYVGMGTDSVTIDAVVDGSLMALTSVTEGTNPKTIVAPAEEQPNNFDTNFIWMLIISISAAVIAVIILLLAIRKMKKAKAVDIHTNGNGNAAMAVDAKDVKGKFKR